MSAASLVSARQPVSGLRPFHPRRDLADVADLVEACFAATLDASGRAAIQEMRLLSRTGPLLWLLSRVNNAVPLMRGFVWIERDRLIGNVSIAPAGYDNGWVIANVAVLPEYRRRGIARRLMQAALEWVEQRKGFATLQVDADNDGARALYASLGFTAQRSFTRWRRASTLRPADIPPDPPQIRRLRRHEAGSLYALAACVRPNEQGGMGWLRPTRPDKFRPARIPELRLLVSGQRTDFWIVPGQDGAVDGALRIETRIGGLITLFDLLVHPSRQGQLEMPLVNFMLYDLIGRRDPLVTEHPDDDSARALFQHYHFRAERTLVHMIRPETGQEETH